MERRRFRRVRIGGKESVTKVISSLPVELVDISRGGARYHCRKRACPQSYQQIVVSNGKSVMILQGEVLRSEAISASELLDGNPPGYDVAIRFLDMEGPMPVGLTA